MGLIEHELQQEWKNNSSQWFEKGMFTKPRCVFVCVSVCLLLTMPPRPAAQQRKMELVSSSFPPSMQKENMDQGLNNTSHCGKYIELHFPLGAASSH